MVQVDGNIREDAGAGDGRRSRTGILALLRWWPFAAAFGVIVGLDAAVYAFVRRRGVSETGDEPHYLVVAKAVSRLTVHPLRAYKEDLVTHRIFNWPAGTQPTNLVLQLYTGPRGGVSTHPIGLSVLLAPFVAVGGERLGRLAVMALGAAGFVYFFHRAAGLARLTVRGRVAFTAVLAGPALWLGATQVYPDFLTGVLLACVVADVAAMEIGGRLEPLGIVVSGASLAVLPWLHQQNLAGALFALAAFTVLGWRHRQRSIVVVATASAASWLLLLAFNLYEYGHAEGLPQPFPSLNGAGVTEILGLLFDRQQGLFVQLPTAVVALVGMWLARRAAPRAVLATLLAAASLIYLNGTFIHAPYGGTSFAGRFEWSSLVPLLVWCPFAIAAVDRVGRRAWALVAAAVVLWVLQSLPVLAGHHQFYNQQLVPGSPWDPAGYPGWWGPVDRILPVMRPGGPQFGVPWFAVLVAVALLLIATAAVAGATRPRTMPLLAAGPTVLVIAGGVGLLTAVAPPPLPSGPLRFPGADVGSPIAGGQAGRSVSVSLQGVSKGSFKVTVDYHVQGPSGSAVQAFCTRASDGARAATAAAVLDEGDHATSMELSCPTGTIGFAASVLPDTTLTVATVEVIKTSST